MYFSFSVASLALLSATALAAPADQAPSRAVIRDVPESIINATALGIDVYGAIPADAVKVTDGYFTAEEGTLAHAWIKAQLDIDWESLEAQAAAKMAKREYASIGIGMFAKDWCNGNAAWHDNVQYEVAHISDITMFSVGISYRGLRNNEQLDFSRFKGSDNCGQFAYSAGKNTPIGCFNSEAINCFRLLRF